MMRLFDPSRRMRAALLAIALLASSVAVSAEEYLGRLSSNPYSPDSIANPFGAGSPYRANGLLNPYSPYGSRLSDRSWTNPYATRPPILVDDDGRFRGTLSANPFDPNSISNPYGRYGSRYSPDSIRNPFGAGSPFRIDSPSNPYGRGLIIRGR